MLGEVKNALRVTSEAFDVEIAGLIEAAKLDLKITGVDVASEEDPLIRRAIITYCKAYFGFDNPDADRLTNAYNMLKNHLSISSDYHTYGTSL